MVNAAVVVFDLRSTVSAVAGASLEGALKELLKVSYRTMYAETSYTSSLRRLTLTHAAFPQSGSEK
eukprot:scaffold28465_cov56-Attheya_sp.AAC.1